MRGWRKGGGILTTAYKRGGIGTSGDISPPDCSPHGLTTVHNMPRNHPVYVAFACVAMFAALVTASSEKVPKSAQMPVQLSAELLKMLNEHFITFGRPR